MDSQKKAILVLTFLFSLASSTSRIFLPLFYLSRGIPLSGVILLLCVTFAVLGSVPFLFMGKNTLALGLMFYSAFYLLARTAHPVMIGVTYGLSMAFFWPAYHRLCYQMTDSENRASFLGYISAIMTATPIVGVVAGGFLASVLGLSRLVMISSLVYFASFFLAMCFFSRASLAPDEEGGEVDRHVRFADKNLLLFLGSYFINGLTDSGWLVYTLFLSALAAGSTSKMGLASASVTLVTAAMFPVVGALSDRLKMRRLFLLLSVPLQALWHFSLSIARTISSVVGMSVFSGASQALMRTGDALYADEYEKKHHPMMIAMREAALNSGRVAHLMIFMPLILAKDFASYYRALALCAFLYFFVFLAIKERHNYG